MDLNVSRDFLKFLYDDMLRDDVYFNVFALPPQDADGKPKKGQRIGKWLKPDETGIETALRFSEQYNDYHNIYFHVSLSDEAYNDHERLNSKEGRFPDGLIGFWADMDIVKTKSEKRYPPSIEIAREIAYATGVAPSMIVETGGGIHAYWLFKEIWFFENEEERERARELSRKWQSTVRKKAHERGYVFDSIADLERIMRLPGTVNHNNGKPVTSRIMEIYQSRRYEIDHFESFFDVLDENDMKPVKMGKTDHFVMREDAKPPFEKLQALLENIEEFNDVWSGKKKFKKGDSQSERDFSLVNYFVRAEWTDQEIVDTLIYYRQERGFDLKHQVYYEKTIGKVRGSIQEDEAAEQLMELDVDEIRLDSNSEEEAKDRIKEEVFQKVSKVLKFRVTRMIKYIADPPTYRMETDRGTVDFGGVANLISPAKFSEKLYQYIGVAISIKGPYLAWMLTLLTEATDLIDLGEEATKSGQLKWLLTDYLEKRRIWDEEDFQRAAFQYQPVRREVDGIPGVVHIFLQDFIKFLRNDHFEQPDKTDIVKQLAIMGLTQKVVKAKNPQTEKSTSRNAFLIPESWQV